MEECRGKEDSDGLWVLGDTGADCQARGEGVGEVVCQDKMRRWDVNVADDKGVGRQRVKAG